jgi:DNA repair exonuclease SbcCD ATPase subunit
MDKESGNNDKEVRENRDIEKIKEKIRWDLEDIKDDLMEELEDLHDDLVDEIEDLKDTKDEIKEELLEELEDLQDERNYILREIEDTKDGIDDIKENEKEQIEEAEENLERVKAKVDKQREKYLGKMKNKIEKAQKKVAKRINISVDSDTSDEWRDWSEELGSSVSELIRKSMKFVKDNIGDFSKLEEWGESIERAVKESGIEDLADEIEREVGGKKKKSRIKIDLSSSKSSSGDTDRIKKRVRGLIKLQKSLPIDKLAQALNRAKEDAENLIYELVDEGIEGTIEEGVFKFTSAPDDVISKINELIDKM